MNANHANRTATMTRRGFLHRAGALSASGLAANLDLLSLAAHAQTAPDYRALVCVFLYGGNDANNTIVPLDASGYAQYAAIRTAASGVQLSQATLLPIQPKSVATPFGMHPSLAPIHPLFASGKAAFAINVGTLTQPTTKAQYQAGVRPASLYSHSDQQTQWQTASSTTISNTGWGGRIADAQQSSNPNGFPVVTSTGGVTLFVTGATSRPLSVPVNGTFGLAGDTGTPVASARVAALKTLLGLDRDNLLVAAASDITQQAIDLSASVNPILAGQVPAFDTLTTSIAQQLAAVAKMIEARNALGAKRQVFFVQLGGFDTHSNQIATQADLLDQLAQALRAFYDTTVALGVASEVTTFTLTEFARTFKPSAGAGTDHAWGGHQLVLGGAVKGGDFYGRFPTLVLEGPDDAEREGRWIPSASVDEYGSTLARWFGVDSATLASVFPNLAKFPVQDLGFL